jgi:hypothetical protein
MLELRVPKMDKNTIESPYTLLMVKALHETGGNRVQASKPPEISYPSLLSKIKKDGIELGQGPLAERELPGERQSAYRLFLAWRHLLQKKRDSPLSLEMVVKNVGRMQKQGGPNKSEREVTRHRRKYFPDHEPHGGHGQPLCHLGRVDNR